LITEWNADSRLTAVVNVCGTVDNSDEMSAPTRLPRTILVVDDEPLVRRVVTVFLKRAGYRTLEAPDASAALEIVRSEQYEIDLAILDVVLPGMQGDELGWRLREMRPDVPLVFISGYDFELNLGSRMWFLGKPFTPEALIGLVSQVLQPELNAVTA
jgi:two-component system, cell cycle sensor histidine kinase and response regulator CckA